MLLHPCLYYASTLTHLDVRANVRPLPSLLYVTQISKFLDMTYILLGPRRLERDQCESMSKLRKNWVDGVSNPAFDDRSMRC